MTKCTSCGREKGWLSTGWGKCQNCGVEYCDNCKLRLRDRKLGFGGWVCVRCGGKVS